MVNPSKAKKRVTRLLAKVVKAGVLGKAFFKYENPYISTNLST